MVTTVYKQNSPVSASSAKSTKSPPSFYKKVKWASNILGNFQRKSILSKVVFSLLLSWLKPKENYTAPSPELTFLSNFLITNWKITRDKSSNRCSQVSSPATQYLCFTSSCPHLCSSQEVVTTVCTPICAHPPVVSDRQDTVRRIFP